MTGAVGVGLNAGHRQKEGMLFEMGFLAYGGGPSNEVPV